MSEEAADALLRAMLAPPRRRSVPRVAEPLRAVQVYEIAGPQGRVAAWRIGEGPAVLLVHGFEDDNSIWRPMIDAFAQGGRAVVVFDLPGHGFSEGDNGNAPAGAEALKLVVRDLGPVDAIVAHSLGGWASALALNDGVVVRRFVAIAPPLGPSVERWRRTAERLGFPTEVGERALARFREQQKPGHRRELIELLQPLAAHLLLIHSRDDERSPFHHADSTAADLGVDLVALDTLSHRETARATEAVAAAVLFVEQA